MIYIIGGQMRCGTTMMMQCMEAGGMKAYYMNKNYELSDFNFSNPTKYENGVVKLLGNSPTRLPRGKYKLVYMMRDPEAVRVSKEKLTGQPAHRVKEHMLEDYKDIEARDDIDVEVLYYEEVVADPEIQLSVLRWPIDVEQAAKVITI